MNTNLANSFDRELEANMHLNSSLASFVSNSSERLSRRWSYVGHWFRTWISSSRIGSGSAFTLSLDIPNMELLGVIQNLHA